MDALIEHLQQNLAAYVIAAVFILPMIWVFRRWVFPVIYHSVEYVVYCAVFHFVLGGLIRVGSWFSLETRFKNFDGSTSSEYVPMTNPLNTNFWMKELYSPEWIYYVEIGAALVLLYIVVHVRPLRYKVNVHRGRNEKPLKDRTEVSTPGHDPIPSEHRMISQRERLQKATRGVR